MTTKRRPTHVATNCRIRSLDALREARKLRLEAARNYGDMRSYYVGLARLCLRGARDFDVAARTHGMGLPA